MILLNIYFMDVNLNIINCIYDNIILYLIYYIYVFDYVCKCIISRGLGY